MEHVSAFGREAELLSIEHVLLSLGTSCLTDTSAKEAEVLSSDGSVEHDIYCQKAANV